MLDANEVTSWLIERGKEGKKLPEVLALLRAEGLEAGTIETDPESVAIEVRGGKWIVTASICSLQPEKAGP